MQPKVEECDVDVLEYYLHSARLERAKTGAEEPSAVDGLGVEEVEARRAGELVDPLGPAAVDGRAQLA